MYQDWYHNTTDNDLLYWGSDYLPLTAHHSWVVGMAAARVKSSWVTDMLEHRLMMRLSVMAADLLILLPAFFMFSASPLTLSRFSPTPGSVSLTTDTSSTTTSALVSP